MHRQPNRCCGSNPRRQRVDKAAVAAWVERYVRAWKTNDPADIGGLFSEDAAYYTGPFDAPWRGRDTIVREWLGRQDAPGTTTFTGFGTDWPIGMRRWRRIEMSAT